MSSNILLRLFLIKQKNFNNKKIAYQFIVNIKKKVFYDLK